MGTQFNHDQKTVRLFFFLSGEIQSTSLAKVQERKTTTNCILSAEGTALFLESTPHKKTQQNIFTKSYVKVIVMFESPCIYKIPDGKNSKCAFNKLGLLLGGKIQTWRL